MKQRVSLLGIAIVALAFGFFARTPDTGGVALRDFEAYYAAGATWHYHGDPYSREIWRTERTIPGVVATRDEVLPFVGPPFGLPVWDAIARLPWSLAVELWHVVMIVSLALVIAGSVRVAGGRIDAVDMGAAAVFGLTFAPLTSGAALGQVALVSCAAIVAMPALLGIHPAFASGFGALVAALQPNLAIVLAARLREPRAWIAFFGAATIAIGGSLVAMEGLGGIGRYFAVLAEHANAERFIAIQTTTGAVARGLGASAHLASNVALALLALSLATIVVAAASRRYAPNDVLALACAALPLAVPFAHEHDFNVVFFPAFAILRRARGALWFVAAGAAIALSVDWLGLAQRPGSTVEAVMLSIGCATALVLLARERSRAQALLPIVAALGIWLVALPAAHHVLPTWPDRLPLDFHVVRTATSAEVWGAEQAASGIGALDPYWAMLRALPLAACALLLGVGLVVLSASPNSERLSTSPRPRAEADPSA